MNTDDGRIYSPEQIRPMRAQAQHDAAIKAFLEAKLMMMEEPPTEKQLARKPPRVGRNDPCPCKSGRKFKRCCMTAKQ